MQKFTTFLKRPWVLLLLGILLGALIILAIRFFSYNPKHTHYHANFAVYIYEQREEFKNPAYYQEVTTCQTGDAPIKPEQRAHMHDNINSVVHVHDDGVTWGDFFTNLGWYVGPNFVRTRDGKFFIDSDSARLHIILNGDDITETKAVSSRVIGDKDRLLISYGNETDATLQQQYKTVPATAAKHDASQDPASCGSHDHLTFQDRFNHLF